MKKTLCVLSFVVAMVLCVSAQTYIDFSYMPIAKVPTPMPTTPDQFNMAWDNFLYVTPGIWTGAGAGFWVDPSTKHNTVAFIGGPYQSVAQGSVTFQLPTVAPNVRTFQPISVTLTAGWTPNPVLVTAYCNSRLVGTVTWNLTTTPTIFKFPAEWTNITQLVFTAEPMMANSVYPQPGSAVMYNFLLVEH